MNSTELRQEKFRIADADGNGKLEGEDGEHRPGGGGDAVLGCLIENGSQG